MYKVGCKNRMIVFQRQAERGEEYGLFAAIWHLHLIVHLPYTAEAANWRLYL